MTRSGDTHLKGAGCIPSQCPIFIFLEVECVYATGGEYCLWILEALAFAYVTGVKISKPKEGGMNQSS